MSDPAPATTVLSLHRALLRARFIFPVLLLGAVAGGTLAATAAGADSAVDVNRLTPVAPETPIPIQESFRPPLWSGVSLSPSGTAVAALDYMTESDSYQLLVHDTATQKSGAVGGYGDRDVYDCYWLDDQRLVFSMAREKIYALGLFAVEVRRIEEPYPLLQHCGARLVGIPRSNRREPLVWMRREVLEDDRDGGVAAIDTAIRTGRFIDLRDTRLPPNAWVDARDANRKHVLRTFPMPPRGIVYHYMADRDGALAFAFTMDQGTPLLFRLEDGRRWIECPIDPETMDFYGPGDKPGELLAAVAREPNAPRALCFVDAGTGKVSDIIVADQRYDFLGSTFRDAGSRLIVGATLQRDGPRTFWFDEGFRKLQEAVSALFPGQVAQIIGNGEQGARFLVRTFSDRNPKAYHWVDLEKRAARLLKNTAPWIDPKRMRPMSVMKFKTRDGRELDAYVTLPAGASAKHPVPLVVLPHGGPWVRDQWGFDGEVQFLASRGYAVLQPNYRGSPGFDWMFPVEDQWDFRKMHDDVTDATRKLLATGAIDRTRVAIMGASFGAYLALSGVAHEPELYRCAVTNAGVFDWETMLKQHKYDRFTDPAYARILRKLGDPKAHAEKYAAISPLRHVQQIKVPVFVAHGKDDFVAEASESRRLVRELEKYNVPHEAHFTSGEGHGMQHLSNQVKLYTQIEAFLAQNLAPKSDAGQTSATTPAAATP